MDTTLYVTLIAVLFIIVYIVYMRRKVRHFVLRNDKIEKYFK